MCCSCQRDHASCGQHYANKLDQKDVYHIWILPVLDRDAIKNPSCEAYRRTNIRVIKTKDWMFQSISPKETRMDFSSVNWLAVIVCVVLAMVSGFVWYHPKVFFPAWWEGIGKAGEPGNPNPMIYVFTIIAAFVQVLSVWLMVNLMGSTTAASGALAGFMLWFGFVAPTNLVNKLFAGQGFKVWAIEAGNHLLNFLLFGAILGAWR